MTTRVRLVVPGDPVPMPRAKTGRNRHTGKVHGYTPTLKDKSKDPEAAKERIRAAARLLRVPYFVGPVYMDLKVYVRQGPGLIEYWKRGSGDRDNYEKLVQDALQGIAYGDDACVVDGPVRKLPDDGKGPRLEIILEGEPGAPAAKRSTRNGLKVLPALRRFYP